MDNLDLDSMFKSFKENLLSYLYMIRSEFEEVNELINTLKNCKPYELDVRNSTTTQNALNIAVVISYARNFKRSFGFYNFNEINTNLLQDFDNEELDLHKKILRDRDKEFAHSDASSHDIQIYAKGSFSHSANSVRQLLEKDKIIVLSNMVDKIQKQIDAQLSFLE